MKTITFFIVGVVCILAGCHVQPRQAAGPPTDRLALDSVTPLTIGDKVPDLVFHQMLNYKDSTARLSDFKGKLVILDFWSTWCGSCVLAFPHLDSLQNIFKGRLKILAVTKQDRETVTNFLDKHPRFNAPSLTKILGDSIFNQLFPHHLIPHEVWISSDGIVRAITGSGEVTRQNISDMLNGKNPRMEQKTDTRQNKPLFSAENMPSDKLVHYSIFLRGDISGLPHGYIGEKTDKVFRVGLTNYSLLDLYKMVGRHLIDHFSDKRMIIEYDLSPTSDTSYSQTDEVRHGATRYSYEIVVPLATADSAYAFMLQDLNKYSGYIGRIEERNMLCFALNRKGDGNLGQSNILNRSKDADNGYKKTISSLISWFNSLDCVTLPVINQIEDTANLDVDYANRPETITELQQLLSKKGLKLVREKQRIKMLFLQEKRGK